MPKIAGPEIDFGDTPLAAVAENVLLLQHFELRGQLHRILSILKMRDGAYDPHIREFVVGPEGFKVLAPMSSATGLLTGIGRPFTSPGSSGGGDG